MVLDARVASVLVFQWELAKLWPLPLAWLWAVVVCPMVLDSVLPLESASVSALASELARRPR